MCFTNREFSFTLKDDVYIRYQSFADQQDMEKEIQKKCPYKIDIGAIFSHRVVVFDFHEKWLCESVFYNYSIMIGFY